MPKDSLRTRVANKFAEANRTGVAPKVSGREQRLVDDVTARLSKANETGKQAEIPKRWAPVVARVARTPQAGFTPELLRAQKQKLKPVEEVHVHRDLNNVQVKRAAGQDVGSFVDLAADARRSMHTLMSKPGGNQMMKELDTRITKNSAHAGDHAKVYIRSLKAGDTSNMNAPHAVQGVQEGYRFDGKEGKGWGSEVRINPDEATSNRFIGLGHEMVHAHRLAHGKAVGVPQLNQANHPLFKDPISQGADIEPAKNAGFGKHLMDVVQTANHLQEEFETVGLSKAPRGAFNPTENMLRTEHGLAERTDYSKTKPGHMDKTVTESDAFFDKRSAATKLWHSVSGGQPPTPVSSMIKRYKD